MRTCPLVLHGPGLGCQCPSMHARAVPAYQCGNFVYHCTLFTGTLSSSPATHQSGCSHSGSSGRWVVTFTADGCCVSVWGGASVSCCGDGVAGGGDAADRGVFWRALLGVFWRSIGTSAARFVLRRVEGGMVVDLVLLLIVMSTDHRLNACVRPCCLLCRAHSDIITVLHSVIKQQALRMQANVRRRPYRICVPHHVLHACRYPGVRTSAGHPIARHARACRGGRGVAGCWSHSGTAGAQAQACERRRPVVVQLSVRGPQAHAWVQQPPSRLPQRSVRSQGLPRARTGGASSFGVLVTRDTAAWR